MRSMRSVASCEPVVTSVPAVLGRLGISPAHREAVATVIEGCDTATG